MNKKQLNKLSEQLRTATEGYDLVLAVTDIVDCMTFCETDTKFSYDSIDIEVNRERLIVLDNETGEVFLCLKTSAAQPKNLSEDYIIKLIDMFNDIETVSQIGDSLTKSLTTVLRYMLMSGTSDIDVTLDDVLVRINQKGISVMTTTELFQLSNI